MAQTFVMRGVEGKIKKTQAEIPPIKSNEVLVKITHSGLCGTDLFFIDPGCALGHEGVGTVEKVGDRVSIHKIGDRVGGGYLRGVSLSDSTADESCMQKATLILASIELRSVQILSDWEGHIVLQPRYLWFHRTQQRHVLNILHRYRGLRV